MAGGANRHAARCRRVSRGEFSGGRANGVRGSARGKLGKWIARVIFDGGGGGRVWIGDRGGRTVLRPDGGAAQGGGEGGGGEQALELGGGAGGASGGGEQLGAAAGVGVVVAGVGLVQLFA